MEFYFKFNKRVGSKNSKQDGKKNHCVGEKTERLDIFLKINKRVDSNNSR